MYLVIDTHLTTGPEYQAIVELIVVFLYTTIPQFNDDLFFEDMLTNW